MQAPRYWTFPREIKNDPPAWIITFCQRRFVSTTRTVVAPVDGGSVVQRTARIDDNEIWIT